MNKLFVLVLCLLTGIYANAAELGNSDRKIIESAGVDIYPGAQFINGSKAIGFRFASSESAAVVRKWYRKQLPSWSLYEKFGGWILYNDKPGLGMAAVMSARQVSIKTNINLPGWFGLDKGLTTEIVVMVP